MDELDRYKKDLQKYRGQILSKEEFRSLLSKYREGDISARDEIAYHNAGLVIKIACGYIGFDINLEDLVSAGNHGLLKAIEKFDLTYDNQFSTYAYPIIKGKIIQLLEDSGALKTPDSVTKRHYKILSVMDELRKTYKQEPFISEIADKAELPEKVVRAVLFSKGWTESLDDNQPCANQEDGYKDDHKVDQLIMKGEIFQPSDDDGLDEFFAEMNVSELMEYLNDEEQKLLTDIYGLNGSKKTEPSEIAKEKGISVSRVSQIKKDIVKKLEKIYRENREDFTF